MTEAYGKRPLWQWVLIYVLVGGLVYGLIYYFVLSKNGGYDNVGTNNMYESEQVQPTPESGT